MVRTASYVTSPRNFTNFLINSRTNAVYRHLAHCRMPTAPPHDHDAIRMASPTIPVLPSWQTQMTVLGAAILSREIRRFRGRWGCQTNFRRTEGSPVFADNRR